MLKDVSAAIERLRSAIKIEDAQDIARDAFATLGFTGYMCLTLWDEDNAHRRFVLFSGWPEAWIERYAEERYDRFDPVLRHLRRRDAPFLASEAPVDPDDEMGQLVQRERQKLVGEYVLAVPVQDDAFKGGVLLAGPREAIEAANWHQAQLLAMTLFSVAHAFSRAGANPLTRREVEMLEWAAQGRTTDEIATELGLTSRTVNTHFENAQRKLGARNRLQTVATALRLRLIR